MNFQILNKPDFWIETNILIILWGIIFINSLLFIRWVGHRRTWTLHSCRKIPLCNDTTTACKHHQTEVDATMAALWRVCPIGFTKHGSMSDTVHACIRVQCTSHLLISEWLLDNCHQTTILIGIFVIYSSTVTIIVRIKPNWTSRIISIWPRHVPLGPIFSSL